MKIAFIRLHYEREAANFKTRLKVIPTHVFDVNGFFSKTRLVKPVGVNGVLINVNINIPFFQNHRPL